MPFSAPSASVSFLLRAKCPKFNANRLSIFARTAATQIPATAARISNQSSKPHDFTLLQLRNNFARLQRSTQTEAMLAFTLKTTRCFANSASTCSQSPSIFRPTIEIQRTITAHTADPLTPSCRDHQPSHNKRFEGTRIAFVTWLEKSLRAPCATTSACRKKKKRFTGLCRILKRLRPRARFPKPMEHQEARARAAREGRLGHGRAR